MNRPELIDFTQERIRVLHYTWIAFFITFYVWFNMAPLATTMLRSMGWLTKDHIKVLAICNVALTIPARIVIGALIDKYGPRIIFSILMVTMAIPAFIFAFGDQLPAIAHLPSGPGIDRRRLRHRNPHGGPVVPAQHGGSSRGLLRRVGKFRLCLRGHDPALARHYLFWRVARPRGQRLALGPRFQRRDLLIYGILYFFLVRDLPGGKKFEGAKKTEPMTVTSYGDLIQYLVWSIPLVGAMAVLTWR